MPEKPLYPHTTRRVGFRIRPPEYNVAWQVLDYEYRIGNEHVKKDVADFLGISRRLSWSRVLDEFIKRYGYVEGEWVCDRAKDAIYYYAYPGEQDEIYRVEYEAKNTVINLGSDGRFVLSPEATFIGMSPKVHATAYR